MSQLIFKLTFVPRFIRQFFYTYFNRLMFVSAGVKFGRNLLIRNRFYLKLYDDGKITIGDNFITWSGENINPLSRNIRSSIFVNTNASLIIGNNVGISSSCIWVDKSIVIGDNVRIGANCTIIDTDCHSLDYLKRRNSFSDKIDTKSKDIIIDNDVLIGTSSLILKGVHIGARSIIGAGSVVTKDIPADCVAAGNPCKVIKYIN